MMPNMLNKSALSSVVLSSEQQIDFHKSRPEEDPDSIREQIRR
jgi:hypothetical protein